MRFPFALTLLGLATATAAQASTTLSFDFDGVAAGSAASVLNTAELTFHNATWAPLQDGDGLDIAGSERWTIDTAADLGTPVTIDNTADWGFGTAPSGTNALNAYSGPVFLAFSQAYKIESFVATLDNSSLGDLGTSHVWFVSSTGVLDQIAFDATQPGLALTKTNVDNVTGIVLQGGSFYDNVSVKFTAIPEPSTYALLAGAGVLGFALRRRLKR